MTTEETTTEETTNQTDWHRLFGLILADYFKDSNYRVELEKDLSIQQEYSDLIVIKKPQGQMPDDLPDGLDNLRQHNLFTYKSHQEALDSWAIEELVGYYVDYRKQESPPQWKKLLPETDFQLYAVCTRYPHKLAKKHPLDFKKEGVYELAGGLKVIRVIVLSQIPQTQRNTMWQLFSSVFSKFNYAKILHQGSPVPELSSIINWYNSYSFSDK